MKEKNIKEKGKKRKAESKNILPETVCLFLILLDTFCSYYLKR